MLQWIVFAFLLFNGLVSTSSVTPIRKAGYCATYGEVIEEDDFGFVTKLPRLNNTPALPLVCLNVLRFFREFLIDAQIIGCG